LRQNAGVTTFLWILAAIGAVGLALTLALSLGRSPGGQAAPVVDESGSRFARDNDRTFNTASFVVVTLVVGGLVALILGLSLS
jgi:hypothetical protein